MSGALSALCWQAVLELEPQPGRVCGSQQLEAPDCLPGDGASGALATLPGDGTDEGTADSRREAEPDFAAGIVSCSLTKLGPGPREL